jgi:hypothetical protein
VELVQAMIKPKDAMRNELIKISAAKRIRGMNTGLPCLSNPPAIRVAQ